MRSNGFAVLTDNAMPVGLELLFELVLHKLGDLLFVEHDVEGVGGLVGGKHSHVVLHELHVDLGLSETHI